MGRDAWVRLGSIWNRFRDCVVVRTRPFSRRQGNVHETLPGAVARAPAVISLQCFPVAVLHHHPALESTGLDSPRRSPSDTESHRNRREPTPCDPDQRIG
jgi:hypothetical protein